MDTLKGLDTPSRQREGGYRLSHRRDCSGPTIPWCTSLPLPERTIFCLSSAHGGPLAPGASQCALEWGPTSQAILAVPPAPANVVSGFVAFGRNSLNAVVLIWKAEMFGALAIACE